MTEQRIRIGYATNTTPADLRLVRQMGVTDVVTAPSGVEPGASYPFQPMLALRKKVEDAGLKLSVFEGMPVTDRIKLGEPGRDEDIDNFRETLRNMGRARIPILCYNWMAGLNWLRTSFTARARGEALATAYNHADMQRGPLTEFGQVTEEQLWESLEYFLKAVVPTAEEADVKLAMHPDDPPLSPIRGLGRIMTSPENFQRMIDLVPSPVNGLTFCQGCFCEMGVDVPATVRHFGRQDKIFFAHFRNVTGTAVDFRETFHDEPGNVDMYQAMKAYYDAGFSGPMRPDHAPTMEGESNDNPSYGLRGRLLGVGYMRGLIEAIAKSAP